jgi:hypothetical protein
MKLVSGGFGAPLMKLTLSIPITATILFSQTPPDDQLCIHHAIGFAQLTTPDRARESRFSSHHIETTLAGASNESSKWTCQAAAHADEACGVSSEWTDGRAS